MKNEFPEAMKRRIAIAASCVFGVGMACAAWSSARAQQQPQQPSGWANLPRMQLERQFAGPLQDTVVQRWRDPADGTVCYIYLPITAAHSVPTQSGYVEYGANVIGSISCLAAPAAESAAKRPPAAR